MKRILSILLALTMCINLTSEFLYYRFVVFRNSINTNKRAEKKAKKNAEKNGITNARFICGDASLAAAELEKEGIKPDVIILDPPRKGSDSTTLDTIILANPKRIVYVSCNPATLARDIKILNKGGYTLDKVTGVDMFANSVHVETVAVLSKK